MGKDLKGKELGRGITQRKDGTYHARYFDRFGKRKSLYATNLKEVREALQEAKYEDKNKLNVIDTNIMLDEWFEKWLNVYKYGIIRSNTRRIYETTYYKHISPILGGVKISEITHLQITGLINTIKKNGYGYEIQHKSKVILLDLFNKAMIDDLVVKNPVKGVKIYKPKRIIRVLSEDEQKIFFECAAGTFYYNLFAVLIYTGLRQGEIAALTWEDIELKSKQIIVNKTLSYQEIEKGKGKNFYLGEPKTITSNRKIPINDQCMEVLIKQKRQRDVVMSKSYAKPHEQYKDLLFTTKYGTPLNSQLCSDAIRAIIDEINLMRDEVDKFETFSAHTFRHTFATRCFESNIKPKIIQKYLGHATLAMTMDLYTHVLEEHQLDEIEKLKLDINNGVFSMDGVKME
ncbi:tyrosine-type recombinase/integrase [Cellulosilyticum sp. ST5]|uniref:tyrosine-type recombinase/integrase n=1 Tax=Cellulosilyticum sp. ST5 TaxID=3055805 RepID=UPI0039773404